MTAAPVGWELDRPPASAHVPMVVSQAVEEGSLEEGDLRSQNRPKLGGSVPCTASPEEAEGSIRGLGCPRARADMGILAFIQPHGC